MRILITGAGGRVGTKVCNDLAKYYQLRLLDIRLIPLPRGEVLLAEFTPHP